VPAAAVKVTLGLGTAPEGTTSADIVKNADQIALALKNIMGDDVSGAKVTRVCVGSADCSDAAGSAARAFDALDASRAMAVDAEFTPVGDAADLSATAFAAQVAQKARADVAALRQAAPAFKDLDAGDLTAAAVGDASRDIAIQSDDDLSGGEIAAIVIGCIAFVAIIAGVFMIVTRGSPSKAANEPVEDEPVGV